MIGRAKVEWTFRAEAQRGRDILCANIRHPSPKDIESLAGKVRQEPPNPVQRPIMRPNDEDRSGKDRDERVDDEERRAAASPVRKPGDEYGPDELEARARNGDVVKLRDGV